MLIFETVINLFQAFVYCDFLIKCLEKKNKYKKYQVYMGFAFSVFIYFQLQSFITDFEGYGILVLIMFTFILSCIFCKANLISNIIYNVLISVLAMFASIIGASIVGIISNQSFLQLTSDGSCRRVVATILIQIIWVGFLYIVLRIQWNQSNFLNGKYTYLALVIPLLSIIICTIILTKMQGANAAWNMVVVIGILILNIVDFVLLHMMNKSYMKAAEDEIIISSYKQQKLDIERIKEENIAVEKNRHEMKRILSLISQMLQAQENEKVVDYLNEMDIMEVVSSEKKLYTDNIVLNYILNRSNDKCMEKKIDFTCIVNGVIDGISDSDIHILMGNLIDNALDAIANSHAKTMYIAISSSEECISMEIVNSVNGDVLQRNPNFEKTTKKDNFHHGYGVKNIRDIVNRYHGNIDYKYIEPNSIQCKIVLIKNNS